MIANGISREDFDPAKRNPEHREPSASFCPGTFQRLLMALRQDDKNEELTDAAKNWLAIDGLWFQAVEQTYGMDAAVAMDCEVWKQFAALEARRVKERLHLPEQGGLDALELAFKNRLFTHVNEYEIHRPDEKTLVVATKTCRVQAARERKGLPMFPCKAVGLVEFPVFARTIDARVVTECLSCPPELLPGTHYCSWKFTLAEARVKPAFSG